MTKRQTKAILKRAYAAFSAESMVFLIAYLAIAGGLPILISPETFAPNSIKFGLEHVWLTRVWGITLLSGGLLTFSGLGGDRPRLERAGQALLCAGAVIFAMVIAAYVGWAAILPGLTYLLFAWSCIARYRKLGNVLNGIELANTVPVHIRKEA